MSVIKPRTTKTHFVRHITRLYQENNETLFAYAAFIGEHTEYVLNQLVETVLSKDKAFLEWREKNSGSHVRRTVGAATRVSTDVNRKSPPAATAVGAAERDA